MLDKERIGQPSVVNICMFVRPLLIENSFVYNYFAHNSVGFLSPFTVRISLWIASVKYGLAVKNLIVACTSYWAGFLLQQSFCQDPENQQAYAGPCTATVCCQLTVCVPLYKSGDATHSLALVSKWRLLFKWPSYLYWAGHNPIKVFTSLLLPFLTFVL